MTIVKRSSARQSAIVLLNNAVHSLKDVEVDWRDKLKKWRKVQLSTGAVTSLDQAAKGNNKMNNSVLVSVLGCLQASFTVEQLQSKVEEQLVKGLRRSAGPEGLRLAPSLQQEPRPERGWGSSGCLPNVSPLLPGAAGTWSDDTCGR